MWQAWDRTEKDTRFWRKNLKERYDKEDLGVDGKIILKWMLGEEDGET
jgi:hypothetical protein